MQRFWGIEQKDILYGLELFEEDVRPFYAILCISPDSGSNLPSQQVVFLRSGVSSSNTNPAVMVQISYSSLFSRGSQHIQRSLTDKGSYETNEFLQTRGAIRPTNSYMNIRTNHLRKERDNVYQSKDTFKTTRSSNIQDYKEEIEIKGCIQ
ncbi:hypothetical protein H5410_036545, partial [Solanum commersonii]